MASTTPDMQLPAATESESETGHKYWACNHPSHRHLLQSTATACMRADERLVASTRKWDRDSLMALRQRHIDGDSVDVLAARYQIGSAYVRVLLRHADLMRLTLIRQKNRWDGRSDPWEWLTTPTHRALKEAGFDSIEKVRSAIRSGALRPSTSGISGRRLVEEASRWLAWLDRSPLAPGGG